MVDHREFKELFPALADELENGGTQKIEIEGVRTVEEEGEPTQVHFVPSVIDYIRRCDTKEQAFEIVDYLLKRGEITKKEARAIKAQIRSQGIRSFGSKKEKDHYLHHGIGED